MLVMAVADYRGPPPLPSSSVAGLRIHKADTATTVTNMYSPTHVYDSDIAKTGAQIVDRHWREVGTHIRGDDC